MCSQESLAQYSLGSSAVSIAEWEMYTDHLTAECDMAVPHHWPTDHPLCGFVHLVHSIFTVQWFKQIISVSELVQI